MSFNKKIITTYAKSLFQNTNIAQLSSKQDNFKLSKITSEKKDNLNNGANLYILGEELLLIRAILISSKSLKLFFNNPTYSEKEKLEIILKIFPGLTITMKSFLKVLTERSHLSLLPEISEEYNKILLKFKNSVKVKLITSSPLNEEFGPILLNNLKVLTKAKEIILNVNFNPKLLGGLILEYNSLAIDASILKEFSLFFNEI